MATVYKTEFGITAFKGEYFFLFPQMMLCAFVMQSINFTPTSEEDYDD